MFFPGFMAPPEISPESRGEFRETLSRFQQAFLNMRKAMGTNPSPSVIRQLLAFLDETVTRFEEFNESITSENES